MTNSVPSRPVNASGAQCGCQTIGSDGRRVRLSVPTAAGETIALRSAQRAVLPANSGAIPSAEHSSPPSPKIWVVCSYARHTAGRNLAHAGHSVTPDQKRHWRFRSVDETTGQRGDKTVFRLLLCRSVQVQPASVDRRQLPAARAVAPCQSGRNGCHYETPADVDATDQLDLVMTVPTLRLDWCKQVLAAVFTRHRRLAAGPFPVLVDVIEVFIDRPASRSSLHERHSDGETQLELNVARFSHDVGKTTQNAFPAAWLHDMNDLQRPLPPTSSRRSTETVLDQRLAHYVAPNRNDVPDRKPKANAAVLSAVIALPRQRIAVCFVIPSPGSYPQTASPADIQPDVVNGCISPVLPRPYLLTYTDSTFLPSVTTLIAIRRRGIYGDERRIPSATTDHILASGTRLHSWPTYCRQRSTLLVLVDRWRCRHSHSPHAPCADSQQVSTRTQVCSVD